MENKNEVINLRKSISNMFDMASREANIEKDIPLPSKKEIFDIAYFIANKDSVRNVNVTLGAHSLIDQIQNVKIFKYNEIDSDKFGNECAFWFKNINLPNQLSFYNQECCFEFKINEIAHFICQKKKENCILDSEKLMKSLKTGCISTNDELELPLQEKSIPNEIIQNSKVEILGEKKKEGEKSFFGIKNKKLAKNKSKFNKTTQDDIIEDKDGFNWAGWMLVTNLDNNNNNEGTLQFKEVKSKSSKLRYVNVSLEELTISQGANNSGPIESFSSDDIILNCEGICTVKQFKQFLEKNEEDNSDVLSYIDQGVILAEGEKNCVILDWKSEKIQRRMFCVVNNDNNDDLIKEEITSFVDILIEIYKLVEKVVSVDDVPIVSNGEIFEIEHSGLNLL